jgi:hypothetical protein
MKIVRKDAILHSGMVNKLTLEKEILLEIRHPFIVSMDFML